MKLESSELAAKLRSEPAPLSFAKLRKAFVNKKAGIAEADLHAALDAAITAAAIFAWPKNSYWHIDPATQLQSEILTQCAVKARKKTEIKVKGRTPKDVTAAIDRLLATRNLLQYPALAGTSVLFVSSGSPQSYWAYVKSFVAEKLKKAGIQEPALEVQSALEEKLWEHLVKLEPDKNVPVSVVRLRNAVSPAAKTQFDEAALQLREQRRVHLSQHDDPHGISAEDKESLIDGKDGRYYVAISRRE
jgi:hypothetical protein